MSLSVRIARLLLIFSIVFLLILSRRYVLTRNLAGFLILLLIISAFGNALFPDFTFDSTRPGPYVVSQRAPRQGALAGAFTVAFFALGNVFRGMAMREWREAVLGTVVASTAALACQVLATRDWRMVRAQLRGASTPALLLYGICGITTTLGSVLITSAMSHMEIALAVLVVHTTPLVIFPVSVLVLKNREELNGRTLFGTALVFAGIGLLALR